MAGNIQVFIIARIMYILNIIQSGSLMHTDLSFITNESDQSLRDRFQVLIRYTDFFDCLVGYFYPSGFHAVYPSLENSLPSQAGVRLFFPCILEEVK